jgi:hypothetical protein
VPPPKRLSEETSELDKQLHRLVAEAASEPLAMNGVSIDTAASLLITAGDHPEWLRTCANRLATLRICLGHMRSNSRSIVI